ncbi:endo-1,4-beta-xylanase [Dactylosporangium siamense]|uniref:Beta-xylanase n=1 Tax=Dactylosporangium siamense TaxID=685454 RepID=A0A919PNT5_9ACTN|nr:endo-1,4-beta-xylanase [Dactylosporangium siamense]GIG48001.1 hypothetical protein Dsi01nite_060420 [Dactylosporangium siamense]
MNPDRSTGRCRWTAHAGALLLVLVGAIAPTTPAGAAPATSLRAAAAARGIQVGAAVSTDALTGTVEQPYYDTLGAQYNLVVAENAMKWDSIHPERDRFDFTAADRLVELAERNGQQVRGHTLAWYSQLPAWVTAITDPAEAERVVREHITTVVGHFKGRVQAWDVVNEAINDGELGGLRQSWWTRVIGPDYIDKAFRWAHEADPAAVLYYNDYETGDLGAKSNAVYDLLRGLKARGVPVGGVGIQWHSRLDRRVDDDVYRNGNRLAALGLRIALTEADVAVDQPGTPAKLAAQADVYRDAIRFCLAQPACTAFVTWGFTDKYSWIPGSSPGYGDALPFDRDYRAKPAFTALLDALNARAAGRPAAPRAVAVDTADRAVRVSWAGVAEAGVRYEVRYGTGRDEQVVPVTGATQVRIAGLTNGRPYRFVVLARTSAGSGPGSAPVSAVPMAGAPRAPMLRPLRPDHNTLAVSWTPVPGATGYVLRYGSTPAVTDGRIDVGPVTTHRLGGLTDGVRTYVSVLAYNSEGDGPGAAPRDAVPALPQHPTLTAAETRAAVTVDGRLDEPDWRQLPIVPAKPTFGHTDDTARGAVTWDTDNIYVAVQVTDRTLRRDSIDPWQDDTVEVFLNGSGTLPKQYDTASDRHFFLRWNDDAVHEQNGKTDGVRYAWATARGGYAVELAVPWRTLGITPGERGARIGVDLAVDDDDTGGLRDGQLTAYGYEYNYLDLSAIGPVALTVRMATTSLPVTPLAGCVSDDGAGRYTAHFGYDNPNDGRVELPANAFSPGTADRGQPRLFARGRHDDAVLVEFDGTPLTWTLGAAGGTPARATVDAASPRCPVVPAVPIFLDDAAPGWSQFTYQATTAAGTDPVHGGSASLAATITGAYGLVGWSNPGAPAQTTAASAVELWLHPGASSAPRTFQVITSDGGDGAPGTTPVYLTIQPDGQWHRVLISMSDLGAPARIGMVFVQDVSGAAGAQPTVYLDDVRLLQIKAS